MATQNILQVSTSLRWPRTIRRLSSRPCGGSCKRRSSSYHEEADIERCKIHGGLSLFTLASDSSPELSESSYSELVLMWCAAYNSAADHLHGSSGLSRSRIMPLLATDWLGWRHHLPLRSPDSCGCIWYWRGGGRAERYGAAAASVIFKRPPIILNYVFW